MLAFERLVAMTGDILILGTKTIPEIPGIPAATVLFPSLEPEQRRAYEQIWPGGPSVSYDPDPAMSYANWWWGFTRSALLGLVSHTFDVLDRVEEPRGSHRDDFVLALRRRAVA